MLVYYFVRVCTYLYSLYLSTWPTTHAHTHALCCLLTVVLDSSWSHNSALPLHVLAMFFTLKRQCHDNRWFLRPSCVGKNNGGQKGRPRKRHFLEENDICSTLVLGGEALHAADLAVLVWRPRHLREQSPVYTRAQKSAKNHWISWHCSFNPTASC